jgi:hypothetical protein
LTEEVIQVAQQDRPKVKVIENPPAKSVAGALANSAKQVQQANKQ